ncbi:14669_t:CDS:1, partial [Rhizophagus irregularis]
DLNDDGQYKIAWLSSGTITIKNKHSEEDEYLTSLGKSFTIKILYIHKMLTNDFEKKALKDYGKVLKDS